MLAILSLRWGSFVVFSHGSQSKSWGYQSHLIKLPFKPLLDIRSRLDSIFDENKVVATDRLEKRPCFVVDTSNFVWDQEEKKNSPCIQFSRVAKFCMLA